MSTTTPPPPPPAPSHAAPPRRLVRLPDQGKIGGVAAGLGWYFGIDPALIRIGIVVATLASGIGIPAYIIAWIILPEERSDAVRDVAPPQRDGRGVALVGLALLAVLLLAGQIDLFSGQVIAAAILIGIGVLLFTDTKGLSRWRGTGAPPWAGPGMAGPCWTGPRGTGPGWTGAGSGPEPPDQPTGPPPSWPQPPPPPAPPSAGTQPGPQPQSAYQPYGAGWPSHPPSGPAKPPKPRSLLGALTFAVWLLGAGGAALLDRIGVLTVTPQRAVAGTLLVIGAGLLVGTVFGNGRGMIWLGLPLLLLLVPLSVFADGDVSLTSGVGERAYAPTATADVRDRYDLFVGSQTIDLSDLVLDGEVVEVDVHMAAGELVVIVPDDVAVQVDGRLRAGQYDVFGMRAEGTGLVIDEQHEGDPDLGSVVIQLDVLLGHVTVETAERR